eukprot:scaffold40074_cov23-Tisochrysis_lutea.AAC.1
MDEKSMSMSTGSAPQYIKQRAWGSSIPSRGSEVCGEATASTPAMWAIPEGEHEKKIAVPKQPHRLWRQGKLKPARG